MATSKKSSTTSSKDPSYRELSAQLDEVLTQLENPELDIDEAVQAYERGLKLVQQLETHVRQAENRVETIRANFSNNQDG